jgi:hypothetical protein
VPHRIKNGPLASKAGAARKLGFSPYLVERAIRDGELELVSCGTKRYITDDSINRLIRKLHISPFPDGDGGGSPAGSDKHAR